MDIPRYPHFTELTQELKPVFDRFFQAVPPAISEFTFTNLFSWRKPYGLTASRMGEAIVLRVNNRHGVRFLPPLSEADTAAGTIRAVMNQTGMPFIRVPDLLAGYFSGDSRIRVAGDRDNADYLYAFDDLVRLSGRRYDGKRNLIKQFKASNAYSYMELDAANIKQCLPFQQAWCVMKDCDRNEGLKDEQSALLEMIGHFAHFHLLGAAISIGGSVQAFVIAEPLNTTTLVIHMLKAEPGITGLYQTMLNEFLSRLPVRSDFVNMEQDLGIPGLRTAKKSYYPVSLVNKNTLTFVP